MGLNIHYIVTNAEDKEQANQKVEVELLNFGNENNYFRIEKTLEVGNSEDKEALEEVINKINSLTNFDEEKKVEDNIRVTLDLPDTSCFKYYELSKYYKRLYEIRQRNDQVLKAEEDLETCNEFYGWQFDEEGITNMVNMVGNRKETDKIFVIKINMHS